MFQKFFGKMVKIKETSFLSTRGMTLMFGNCVFGTILQRLQGACRKAIVYYFFLANTQKHN